MVHGKTIEPRRLYPSFLLGGFREPSRREKGGRYDVCNISGLDPDRDIHCSPCEFDLSDFQGKKEIAATTAASDGRPFLEGYCYYLRGRAASMAFPFYAFIITYRYYVCKIFLESMSMQIRLCGLKLQPMASLIALDGQSKTGILRQLAFLAHRQFTNCCIVKTPFRDLPHAFRHIYFCQSLSIIECITIQC